MVVGRDGTARAGAGRAGPGPWEDRERGTAKPAQFTLSFPSLSSLSLSPSSCPRACLLAAAAGVARRRGRGAREAGRPARRPLILLEIEQEELAA
jgi:hypothetical protein